MQFSRQGQGDFIIFLLFILLVAICCSQKSSIAKFFKGSKNCLLSRLSLAIYLNQAVLLLFAQSHRFGTDFKSELIVYVAGTIVISFVSLSIVESFRGVALKIYKIVFV